MVYSCCNNSQVKCCIQGTVNPTDLKFSEFCHHPCSYRLNKANYIRTCNSVDCCNLKLTSFLFLFLSFLQIVDVKIYFVLDLDFSFTSIFRRQSFSSHFLLREVSTNSGVTLFHSLYKILIDEYNKNVFPKPRL